MDLLQGHQQIRYHIRVIVNVLPTDVENPGYLIKGAKEDCIGPLKDQPFAKTADLCLTALPHKVLSKGDDGRGRDSWPVLPKRPYDVRNRYNYGRWNRLLQFPHGCHALAQGVNCNCGLVQAQGSYPLGDGNLLRDAHLVKLNTGSGELPVCLYEVAGVRPQAGVVHCYHNVPGLPGEP